MRRLLLAALLLPLAPAGADPLHPRFADGLWRHEFSGWLFPARLGALPRGGDPFSIDGNDDAAGAVYGAPPGPVLTVEVFGRASTDPRATPAGARTRIAEAHPGLPPGAGQAVAMQVRGAPLQGSRVRFGPGPAPLWLYHLQSTEWVVHVVVTGLADEALVDSLVRGLPWDSLGSPERLH